LTMTQPSITRYVNQNSGRFRNSLTCAYTPGHFPTWNSYIGKGPVRSQFWWSIWTDWSILTWKKCKCWWREAKTTLNCRKKRRPIWMRWSCSNSWIRKNQIGSKW
jgi:hypothetical protein